MEIFIFLNTAVISVLFGSHHLPAMRFLHHNKLCKLVPISGVLMWSQQNKLQLGDIILYFKLHIHRLLHNKLEKLINKLRVVYKQRYSR